METEKLLLSKREVAHVLSLSLRTVDSLLKRNLLTGKRIGRRILIPKSSLDQFVSDANTKMSACGRDNQ